MEEGDDNVISTAFHESYTAHADGKSYTGHDFIRRYGKQLRKALTGIKLKELLILQEDESKVTWSRTFTGTHEGSLRGIPPSGRKITWQEMVVSRMEGDKIAEEWLVSDLAGKMMIALGKK